MSNNNNNNNKRIAGTNSADKTAPPVQLGWSIREQWSTGIQNMKASREKRAVMTPAVAHTEPEVLMTIMAAIMTTATTSATKATTTARTAAWTAAVTAARRTAQREARLAEKAARKAETENAMIKVKSAAMGRENFISII